MAVGKEIRNQIQSVKNTQKITKAMELVAASKMRKAQDRMGAARPYADRILTIIEHIADANTEFQHPYLVDRPHPKKVGFIVVSTDRGLCGGLNINVFKQAIRSMREWNEQGAEIQLALIGKKAQSFFKRTGGKVVAQVDSLGDSPHLNDIIGLIQTMLTAYDAGEIDRLYIVRNEFVNTMTQQAQTQQLLPVQPGDIESHTEYQWDYIYEPDAETLLSSLMTRYIESQAYRAVVENVACEMAARMVAMKSATDNAGTMINELQLVYNKARQAAITQELSEIVAGAAAV